MVLGIHPSGTKLILYDSFPTSWFISNFLVLLSSGIAMTIAAADKKAIH
jgi:hypothetical protein